MQRQYPIGIPGQPWGEAEKQQWFESQSVKRSYFDDVVSEIDALTESFDVHQYGTLDYQTNNYPLYVLKAKQWQNDKPVVLVTGGVHGYETSGVHGALRFAKTRAGSYTDAFNILVAPCISPWGYETINRWNPAAEDPNRSFVANSPAPEAANIMGFLAAQGIEPLVHIDLHETTDTDNSEFRPALAAREGTVNDNWNIPDGFYLVANASRAEVEFQRSVLREVEKVTHIAEADDQGKLIGVDITEHGMIHLPADNLGLCMGLSQARFTTTTEVYPDSPKANPEQCILAQVAAVTGGLDYVRGQL
ncbi:hypothetical protein HMF8227_01317 [Saliniradius amylolyticus]|uniref:Peptidase M14 domain-containing protein n=1 Tax=Saliniradius amylolyticus TaxID=2183582 RepID=A0A2S2E2B9_9ALTE|nr:M14 family metallocarboxypeptidase [Saliniradius amylolyticus]AWL11795.1 hypothetical protein HMF8227_01317 [Saliniradius amylolyticus]